MKATDSFSDSCQFYFLHFTTLQLISVQYNHTPSVRYCASKARKGGDSVLKLIEKHKMTTIISYKTYMKKRFWTCQFEIISIVLQYTMQYHSVPCPTQSDKKACTIYTDIITYISNVYFMC